MDPALVEYIVVAEPLAVIVAVGKPCSRSNAGKKKEGNSHLAGRGRVKKTTCCYDGAQVKYSTLNMTPLKAVL